MKMDCSSTCAVLSQGRLVTEITRPLDGVWRIRISPLADGAGHLREKQSFAIPTKMEHPLHSDGYKISAGEDHIDCWAADRLSVVHQGNEMVKILGCVTQMEPKYPRAQVRTVLRLSAREGEQYVGLGEKVGPLDKRGMGFTFWNTDVLPHHPDTDPLYQSIPFFLALGEEVWGCFLDETTRSHIDVAQTHPDEIVWTIEGPEADLYLFSGPTPADVIQRYTELTGRTPLPPLWSLGAHQSRWGYEQESDVWSVIEGYRSRRLPLDVIHLDIDYMQAYKVFTIHPSRYPDMQRLSREALEQGVRLVTIVDPGIKKEEGYDVYDTAVREDFLVKTWRGDPLIGEVWPDPAVFPDFLQHSVRLWWGNLHRTFIESGISGFWNDMNEPSCFSIHSPGVHTGSVQGKTLPDDALHGALRHLEVHNVYGLCMAMATFEGLRSITPEKRPFVLTRAGYAGIQRYSAVWTGDNSSYWDHLEMNLSLLLGLSISGVPFVGSDIGGFGGNATGELLVRWTQMGVFYPFMRNHSAAGTQPQEPWRFGEVWVEPIRLALELRYRLLPYLYRLMEIAEQTGAPPLRPMLWHYPKDATACGLSDQFMFGEDVLVAPVIRPKHRHRTVYFPSNGWIRIDTLEAGRTYSQGFHVVNANLDQIPMFLRPGGILPLAEPSLHTQTAEWTDLTVWVNAQGTGSFSLLFDEGDGYGDRKHLHFHMETAENQVQLRMDGDAKPSGQVVFLGLPQGVRASEPHLQTEDGLYTDFAPQIQLSL
ncbi:MAG: glycoside hydrolase family 31 protein [Deinococcaceae bacterium]